MRTAALAIDSLIRFALYLALIPLLALSGLGLGLVLLGLFLLEWFYPVFFELLSGATPGKSAMGLRVVHDDGTRWGPWRPSSATCCGWRISCRCSMRRGW